jgi:intein/homing endonuclease
MILSPAILRPPYIKSKNFCANPIIKYGIPKYADSVKDPRVINTPAWEEFWNEEIYKIINGVTSGGVYMPGRFYYYMNYKRMSTIKGVISPDMVDLHLELAYYIDYCKANGKNLLSAKGRRKGISEAAATMVIDYGWRFTEAYQAGVAAGSKTYVDDFLSKWRFADTGLPPELSVKKLLDNDDKIIAGYSIRNSLGAFEEQGTKNTIYARTMHINPNMFKGLYLNDLEAEEIGEFEKFIAFYSASKDCLMSGNIQTGMLMGFGCVCAGTKVWNNKGELVNIEDLNHMDGIIGYDFVKHTASKEYISYWQPPSEKMCYKITTNTGRVLECSEDHPILCRIGVNSKRNKIVWKKETEFRETQNLTIRDQIATIESVGIWSNKRMFEPRIIGWAVGDGSYGMCSKGCFNILMINADEEMYRHISSKYQTRVDFTAPTKDGRILRKFRINGIYLRDSFRDMGIVGQTKDNKRLPNNLHSYCKKDVCEFIGGYFDADGCIYCNPKTKETFLKLTSANYAILDEMRLILQKIGIRCNIMYEKMGKSTHSTRGHYNLIIKDNKSINCFHENIHFRIKKKQAKFNKAIKILGKPKFERNQHSGLRFEVVKSLECIGMKPIYNLTAATTNTYVANGIITHNTGGNVNKGSKDFKKVWAHAEDFNMIKFLIPATRFYFYGGATEKNRELQPESDLLKKYKPYQLIGCEDLILSEKFIRDRRDNFLKQGNLKEYNEDLQNNPLNETEIFRKTVVNNFDIEKLNNQMAAIDALPHPKWTKYKMEWVKDDKGMIKMPLSVICSPIKPYENQDECIWIIDGEHPRKGYQNLATAGLDSYDQDTAKASKSLGAMCIRIRANHINNAMSQAPVAVISCRPKRKEKFYELCLMASVYYNLIGNVLVDVGAGVVMEYFREHGGWKYLADRPRKFESETSEQTHEKGVRLTNFSRPRMSGLMQADIVDHVQNNWFPELINQLGNFDEVEIGSDNDLADAYGLALMQDVSCDVRPRDQNNQDRDDKYDLPEFELNNDGELIMRGESRPFEGHEQDGDKFGF